ncbi:VOC family protein [Microbaculum marinum]|uniref:VOC family protein n=1 Tax=Microbaculum marinum TaxID=1764581 RepID=A0AAW9RK59_9HYPH
MLRHFDHMTIVVRDMDSATAFFGHLGFELDKDVVISGKVFEDYMGVPGIEAQHVTLALPAAPTRTEIQLLHYLNLPQDADPGIADLTRLGFNHICFAVDDLDAEVARLRAAGVTVRTDVLDFHQRKLVFLTGPEGVTVELSEWEPEPAAAAQ